MTSIPTPPPTTRTASSGTSSAAPPPAPARPRTLGRRARTPEAPPPRSLQVGPSTRVLTWVVALVALAYFLFPIYWLLVSSTKSNSDLLSSHPLWFGENNIAENYQSLQSWTQGLFWRWVGNSVLYSTVAGVVGTLVSVSAGYALAKFRFPGSTLATASPTTYGLWSTLDDGRVYGTTTVTDANGARQLAHSRFNVPGSDADRIFGHGFD